MNKLTASILAIAISFFVLPSIEANADSLIENVTLIDGRNRPPLENASVLVQGDRIALVQAGHIDVPDSIKRIDGAGKFLMPGLFDAHIHLDGGRRGIVTSGGRTLTMDIDAGLRALHGFLYNGVTSVYDSGNNPDYIFKMRADERSGEIVSPRIFAAGSVVAFPGGYASGAGSAVIGSPDDFDKLQALLDRNPDMVKIAFDPRGSAGEPLLPSFSPELLKAIVEYCQRHGFRTTIHAYTETTAGIAIDAGVNAFAHVMPRGLLNEEFATYIASKKIPMATTMVVYSNIARVGDDASYFDDPLYVSSVTSEERERQKTTERERYLGMGWPGLFKVLLPYFQKNVANLHAAGVPLALGTDRTMGPAVHQELALLIEAGLSPADAIQIATYNAAVYVGKEEELGSIERGKIADMLLLDADPTIDIANITKISAIFKGGQEIDRSQLKVPANN